MWAFTCVCMCVCICVCVCEKDRECMFADDCKLKNELKTEIREREKQKNEALTVNWSKDVTCYIIFATWDYSLWPPKSPNTNQKEYSEDPEIMCRERGGEMDGDVPLKPIVLTL